MNDNCRDITITEVESPSHFLGKEVPGPNMSNECREFNRMQDKMNSYFNNQQSTTTIPSSPEEGGVVYAAKRPCDHRWYRVRVKKILQSGEGPKALCYFVDHDRTELIPVSWLRTLPEVYSNLPEQIQTFCLSGVEPLTLATTLTDEDIVAEKQRCKQWDTAAIKFFKDLHENSSGIMAEMLHAERQNNTVHVRLFAKFPNATLCFNDELCQKEYAAACIGKPVTVNESPDVVTPKVPKKKITPKEYLKLLDVGVPFKEKTTADCGSSSDSSLDATMRKQHCDLTGASNDVEHGQGQRVLKGHHLQELALSDVEMLHNMRPSGTAFASQSDSEMLEKMSRRMTGGRGKYLQSNLNSSNVRSERLTPHVAERTKCAKDSRGKPDAVYSSGCESDASSNQSSQLPLAQLLGGGGARSIASDSDQAKQKVMGRGRIVALASNNYTSEPETLLPGSNLRKSDSPSQESLASILTKNMSPDESFRSLERASPESYCDIPDFSASRLPKFAKTSTEGARSKETATTESKLESILKKSPSNSVSGLDSSSVRFAESVTLADTDGIEDWRQRKGKQEGQRLLESLCSVDREYKAPARPQLNRPDLPPHDPFLGVIVHGKAKPNAVCDFTNLPFAELIKQTFLKKNFESPKVIQSYCWPAVMRGRHVVGISPPQTGKTHAYLLPLLSHLFEPTPYIPIPVGNGPFALILVPSWKKVQAVLDICLEYVQQRKQPRVLAIFAGGCEESQAVPLINGCEVLIATPPCLIRMLDKQYTNLRRLCHLVLDDAEILVDLFKSEIKSIMKCYASVLKEVKLRTEVNRQHLVFANQWTKGIESFMNAYLVEPLVIISSKLEASVYGRVKQVVLMSKYDNRSFTLCGLLDEVAKPGHRIVICSSSVDEVIMLTKLLRSRCYPALVSHTEMPLNEQHDMYRQWRTFECKDEAVIMVLLDECVTDSVISDATVVIHYDMPRTRLRFGNRMTCMLNYFNNFSEDKEPLVKPTSFIMVTEECQREANNLQSFLQRSECQLPRAMTNFFEGRQMGENEDQSKDLCVRIKAFGFCSLVSKCKCRHLIAPETDCPRGNGFPDLPKSGEVKIRMSHIVDASHYFARLLEHRGETKTDMTSTFIKLEMDIAKYFASTSNRLSLANAKEGDLCALQDKDLTYHRVKILRTCDSEKLQTPVVRVHYIDEGHNETVYQYRLIALPAHLKEVPYQAVEVFLCHVKPMDHDSVWTPKASNLIFQLLNDITLEGCIVLSMGNTLWLDPIVQRVTLRETKVTTNTLHVREELMRNGLAANNPEHVESLYKLCQECEVEVPAHLLSKYDSSYQLKLEVESFPEDQEFHDIYVSIVGTPDLFHVQLKEMTKQFEDMIDEINKKMKTGKMVFEQDLSLNPGVYCLAQFSEDDKWYRAQIVEKSLNDNYNVFFCDFGDNDNLPSSKLRPLPDKYTDMPCQAIECKLGQVIPRGENWDDSSGDALWDMTHFLTGEKKLLVAKILSKSAATYQGKYKYILDLYDTNSAVDIQLAQELVWRRYALSCDLEDRVPKPAAGSRKVYESVVHKIPDQCASIYWGENETAVMRQAEEVATIVTAQSKTKSNAELMVSCGGVASICRLIGYLGNMDAHQKILEALTLAVLFSPRITKAAIAESLPRMLVRCLEQSNFPALNEQSAKAISRLVTVSSFREALEEAEVTPTLCDLLEDTHNSELQKLSLHVLASLLKESESVSEDIEETSLCLKAPSFLTRGVKHDVIEAFITFLASMARWDNCHSKLKRKPVLDAVVQLIEMTACCQCLYKAVQFCKRLSEANRKNKTLLLEHRLAIVLHSVLDTTLDSRTKHLCQELLDEIVVCLPQLPQVINNPRISARETAPAVSHVDVSWHQNSFRAVVTFHVRGVKEENFTVTDRQVVFRSPSHDTSFLYDLCDEVLPVSTKYDIQENSAKVSLKKKTKGKWKRLLKEKLQMKGVRLDFDRLHNSDSEVSDGDEPFILSKRKERKLPKRDPGKIRRNSNLESLDTSEESSDLASYSDDERKDMLDFL